MNDTLQKNRFPWLDALRFISAILVVIAHCRSNFFAIFSQLASQSQTLSTKIFYLATSFSDDAVFVFFILSGFLVGGTVLDKLNKRVNVDWREFLISRFTRILLPLFATLLLCLIIYTIEGSNPPYIQILGNALSLQGLFVESEGGVLWTMPYIIWSYVFLLSLIQISNQSMHIRVGGIILFGLSITLFLAFPHPKCFLAVALGALAYFIRKIKLPRWFILVNLIVVLSTALIAKFAKPSISRDTSMLAFVNLDVLNFIESFCLSIVISRLVNYQPTRWFGKWINSISTKLAKFSYSIYLVHYCAIRLMIFVGFPKSEQVNFTSILFYISEIAICILFGYIFYILVEKNTPKVKRYFMSKLNR